MSFALVTDKSFHNGYGLCNGFGSIWVDDGEASNFYREGSCPRCIEMAQKLSRPIINEDLVSRKAVLALLLKWRLESGPISTAVYDVIRDMPAAGAKQKS